MRFKHLFYFALLAFMAVVFLWSRTGGIVLAVAFGLILLMNWSVAMQDNAMVKTFGPDLARKIQQRKVEVGMRRHIVEMIWGRGVNERKRTDATGVWLTCDHWLVEGNGRERYRFYAVYRNGQLMEFGAKK
ncbi:MAG: hypothetical protein WAU70_03585 [Flavobacteriales bacterium]